MFDPRYKIIIKFKCSPGYTEMLEWVDKNSAGSVDIKFDIGFGSGIDTLYIGFERPDDATFFKIKYSV